WVWRASTWASADHGSGCRSRTSAAIAASVGRGPMSIPARLSLGLSLLVWAVLASLTPPALAQPSPAPTQASTVQGGAPAPTVDSVQKSLDALGSRNLPEAERNALEQLLEQTLAHLKSAEENASRLQQLKDTLDDAPARIQAARAELERIRSGAD